MSGNQVLRVRDSHALPSGPNLDDGVVAFPSGGMDLLGEDGRVLYTVKLKGGRLEIISGNLCQVDGVVLNDALMVLPCARNYVVVERPPYKPE